MMTSAERDSILARYATGHYVGLLSAITDRRAGTVTELSYTDYARVALTLDAAEATSPAGGRQRKNSGALNFAENPDGDVAAIGYGVYAASSGGSPVLVGSLDDDAPIVGTASATGDIIEAPAHGLATDQRVFVQAFPGALLPAGLSEDTAYFVLAAGLTADAFALSTTSGGSAVNITAKGAAFFIPYKAQTIATNATPSIAAGLVKIQF